MIEAIKKSRIFKKAVGLLVSYTCQRWSIVAPLIVYLGLFGFVKLASLPLRSNSLNPEEQQPVREYAGNNYIASNLGELPNRYNLEIEKSGPLGLLEVIFHRADTNKNEKLSTEELSEWINIKTHEHIHNAMMENYGLFTSIDRFPRNGVISWEEYHKYFLQKQGFSEEYANQHDEKHPGLNRSIREAIMRDKAAWSETAKSDPDHLTVDEFLAFRHPESSHATILGLVEELIEKFDRDGDDVLTEDEFSSLQTDGETPKVLSPVEAERRREFREAIDVSKDGQASRHELLMYLDPKNPRHAKEEAETLIIMADVDHDGQLSLPEILQKADLFLGSKMVDTATSFHDEF